MSEENKSVCANCDNEVSSTDDYCPECGNLFIKDACCINHPDTEAEGVCVICGEPYCDSCCGEYNNIYLCTKHEYYEIYEGMVRVYGSSDDSLIQYVFNALMQKRLHPFLYSRKATHFSMGGVNYNLFRASGEFDGHIINETKVMVPFAEAQTAEEFIKDLDV